MGNRIVALLIALTAILASCGDDDDAATGGEDGSALLQQSADALTNVSSFHFVLTHDNGTTPIILELGLERAEGDVVMPDRLSATLEAKRGSFNAEVKTVVIGRDVWITDPFLGRWQKQSNVTVPPIITVQTSIPQLMKGARDARLAGEERIDGVDTRRVRATIEGEALAAVAPVVEVDKPVPVTLWIGKDDNLPRRLRIDGPLSRQEDDDIRRRFDLSRFNADVRIDPP